MYLKIIYAIIAFHYGFICNIDHFLFVTVDNDEIGVDYVSCHAFLFVEFMNLGLWLSPVLRVCN